MIVLTILLAACIGMSLLYWLLTAWRVVRLRRAIPVLSDLLPPEPQTWPRLSVVVPARNEAQTLPAAAETLLAADYPDLEIILVDDRSTDGTGRAVDELARRDGRVRAVHVTELPEGWLGKVNALSRGLTECSGEYVLFTDADVHFGPRAFRKAVALCRHRGLDHLAGLPDVWPVNLVVDALIAVFLRHFLTLMTRAWAVSDPDAPAYMGIGAFNLVRRSALEATEGFEWLRLEVGDDMGLGLMMKRSGARCAVVAAFGDVGLHWHRSLKEAAVGAEKGCAKLSRYRLSGTAVLLAVVLAVELAPVLGLLPLAFEPVRPAGYLGLGVFAAYAFSVVLLARWAGLSPLPGLVGPLLWPLTIAIAVRAARLARKRGGIEWRGTLYSPEALRAGSRVRLP